MIVGTNNATCHLHLHVNSLSCHSIIVQRSTAGPGQSA